MIYVSTVVCMDIEWIQVLWRSSNKTQATMNKGRMLGLGRMPRLDRIGSDRKGKAANDNMESVYGEWMTVVKPQRRAPKYTLMNHKEAAPPQSQPRNQAATSTAKERVEIKESGISFKYLNRSGSGFDRRTKFGRLFGHWWWGRISRNPIDKKKDLIRQVGLSKRERKSWRIKGMS